MFNKNKKSNYENPEEGCSIPAPPEKTNPSLALGLTGAALQNAATALGVAYGSTASCDAHVSRNELDGLTDSFAVKRTFYAPDFGKMSYADYMQMQNLFSKLEKFLDAQAEKPYKTNLELIKSFNSKQLALFVIRDVKKILSGTDSAVEELEAWLNEAPTLSE